MRRMLSITLASAVCLLAVTTCNNRFPSGQSSYPSLKSARALSTHYVLVQFDEPANALAADPGNYVIVGPDMEQLAVNDVALSTDMTQATLTTAEQEEVQYQLMMGSLDQIASVSRVLPIGALGFFGTSQREPFLESAVSLSSTEILLTFSQQMDRTSAETVGFYEIADPDGNTDIDIRITGAALQADWVTVILTTTPQENIEYRIRATNVKRRFSCEDEGRIFLDDAAQGTTCAGNYRPVDPTGTLANFVLTSRTRIDRNAPLDPDATGVGGSVGLEANGAGVRRALCLGGTTGIDGSVGFDPDEELIFTADRPELAENIVLGVRSLDFAFDEPVLFLSSDAADGFDYIIPTADIQAAFNAGVTAGDIVFANLPSLSPGLKIDTIKLRETSGEIWVHSVCGLAINRWYIDPTRNTALFYGIPPVDNAGPRVVRAESTSDTEVIVSFSEPLDSEAANPLNFRISPDLTVIDARIKKYDTQVVLTTSPQHVDVLYTVTVSNVRDKAGNLIDPAANSATFTYGGGPAGLGADALPRVVGAASTGNTGVLVVFTKPMGPSAEVASNYVIVQENVNPEVGALAVLSASFASGQQDAVQLVTASQNEVTYNLQVINVRDLSGNQLAPPQLLVDPSRAIFAGTPFSCGDQPCSPPDADGDTLSDAAELRGYVVTVELTNGTIVEREVTSDPNSPDTDGDGLGDEVEKLNVSDPRSGDTDGDLLSDYVEYNFVYSSLTDQDTDDDGNNDYSEVAFFKTNALLADSDGDGFDDDVELYEMNRDPRVADLPSPGLSVRSVDLHLEESFSYTDDFGRTTTEESSSQSTLSSSTETTTTNEVGFNLGIEGKVNFQGGFQMGPFAFGGGEVGASLGFAFQHTSQSARSTMQAFETSMSKGLSLTNSSSSTREVTGGRIDAMVDLKNLSDVAFTLGNLEITVSTTDPVDRTQILPVATLVPNSALVTGESPQYNLGVLDNASRGPILFSSRDVFPTLVEDLMRDPRGLIFEFANYDLTDEFDRNFAYASQTARDRTVGLVVDFGDNHVERYFVAYAAVQLGSSTCDPVANPGCNIVGGFAGFSDANIPEYQGIGPPPGLPLEYVLEEVLLRRRSEPVVTPVWLPQPPNPSEKRETYYCDGGFNDGAECDSGNGDVDCEDGLDDGVCSNVVPSDGILVGPNGVSDSIAQGDDIQLIPFGIDGLPEDAVVISAGADGKLNSTSASDDPEAVITGYATTKTCGPGTPSSIRPGPNGVVETLRDPFSDDVQLEDFGSTQGFGVDEIGPGANGFVDTAAAGDDVYVGPGIPCDGPEDCPIADGDDPLTNNCNGQEVLYRFDRRARGQFGRAWAVLLPDDSLLGLDFRKVVLKPGEAINLGFVQDLDRDGLISDVEFLFGSSDTRQDTDGDGLDDFSEIRVGWEVGVEGQDIRRVFPDPRLTDTDRDGLNDREEQDFRRVQCECINSTNGDDDGEACTRSGTPTFCVGGENDANDCIDDGDCPDGTCEPRPDTPELCRGGTCVNVADRDLPANTPCTSNPTSVRLDPRRRDTDDDSVTDAEEVLGWLTQAAVIDPQNVIVAGPNRRADTVACPEDVCQGGSMPDQPCRFDRDCGALKVCTKGINKGVECFNDIECQGPTPATTGLCEEASCENLPDGVIPTSCTTDADCAADEACTDCDADNVQDTCLPIFKGICNRTGCDDVQVIEVSEECATMGTDCVVGLDPSTVVVAPGPDGVLHADTVVNGDDVEIGACSTAPNCQPGEPDLRASTTAQGDDQQVAIVDPNRALDQSTVLLRTIARPGINGVLDTLQPSGDDVVAFGQFIQTTDPLKPDTDQDQITEGNERRLGSDPRNPADGGLLADRDGDGLTDQQESVIGWVITVDGVGGSETRTVFSNPNNPDSDNDGLPDLAESILRTDPTLRDTDGDSLEDFDEVSEEQFDDLEQFNDLFPGYFLDRDFSMVYGTSPLDCDSDNDALTDDFEVLEGFDVTVRVENGVSVFHVFTDPANPDTDFDGLTDGQEYKHRVKCADAEDCEAAGSSGSCSGGWCTRLLPTDPTDYDSDDDGRKDGDECPTALTPPTGCADLTQPLAECDTHPLVPDKLVTIRFVELVMDQGDEDGDGDLVDISWIFGAQRSDETFPGTLWSPPLSTTYGDCVPTGRFGRCSGGECQLKEGDVVVFGSDSLGFCVADSECSDLVYDFFPGGGAELFDAKCSGGQCLGCYNFGSFLGIPLGQFCIPLPTQDGIPDNERTFALRPGKGILIYGEVREWDKCGDAKCASGPHNGASCNGNPGACCEQFQGTCNDDDVCESYNTGAACSNDSDCVESECGVCQPQTEAASMVTYFKTLSFESVTEGFTTDIGFMNDASTNNAFRTTIVTEIIVR